MSKGLTLQTHTLETETPFVNDAPFLTTSQLPKTESLLSNETRQQVNLFELLRAIDPDSGEVTSEAVMEELNSTDEYAERGVAFTQVVAQANTIYFELFLRVVRQEVVDDLYGKKQLSAIWEATKGRNINDIALTENYSSGFLMYKLERLLHSWVMTNDRVSKYRFSYEEILAQLEDYRNVFWPISRVLYGDTQEQQQDDYYIALREEEDKQDYFDVMWEVNPMRRKSTSADYFIPNVFDPAQTILIPARAVIIPIDKFSLCVPVPTMLYSLRFNTCYLNDFTPYDPSKRFNPLYQVSTVLKVAAAGLILEKLKIDMAGNVNVKALGDLRKNTMRFSEIDAKMLCSLWNYYRSRILRRHVQPLHNLDLTNPDTDGKRNFLKHDGLNHLQREQNLIQIGTVVNTIMNTLNPAKRQADIIKDTRKPEKKTKPKKPSPKLADKPEARNFKLDLIDYKEELKPKQKEQKPKRKAPRTRRAFQSELPMANLPKIK
jgi:hypothetical protein